VGEPNVDVAKLVAPLIRCAEPESFAIAIAAIGELAGPLSTKDVRESTAEAQRVQRNRV